MDKALVILSIIAGIITIGSLIFNAGYTYKALHRVEQVGEELVIWKDNLNNTNDERYLRKDVWAVQMLSMNDKMTTITEQLDSIHEIVDRRAKGK